MKRDTKLLATIFTISGVLHFVKPEPFESIVPKPLPYKRELVYASGVAELACVAMLANPQTRRAGGLVSAGLLAAVFPANAQMAIDTMQNSRAPRWMKAASIARLPLQIPMIKIALRADDPS